MWRGVARVVAHHQHRETAVRPEPAEQIEHLVAQRRPERGKGLVEEEHRAPAHQCAGQRDALSLASGELAGAPAVQARKAHPFESAVDLGVVLAIQPERRVQPEPHVGGHIQVREQVVLLEDNADRAQRRLQRGDVPALDRDAARSRRLEAGDQGEQRALARTARTDHRDALSGRDLEREPEVHVPEPHRQGVDAQHQARPPTVRSSVAKSPRHIAMRNSAMTAASSIR